MFLCLAVAAWLISKLSETYTHEIAFRVAYQQPPDSLILMEQPPATLPVRVRASGFKLMAYQVSPKEVFIDMAASRRASGRYFIDPGVFRSQVERQMDNGMALLELPSDTVYLDFQRLQSRTVPVVADIEVELAQNYMIQGSLQVNPPRIHLLGPPEEIDTIRELRTLPARFTDVRDTIRTKLTLGAASRLKYTQFSATEVVVSAPVLRFSETVVDVPVRVVNIPEDLDIRTFPTNIGVLCRGTVDALKAITPADFTIVADYARPDPESGRLPLSLEREPAGVYETSLLETSVEFIIRRE